MKNFADRLQEKIDATGNPTVLGLDPMLEYIPERILSYLSDTIADPYQASGRALFEFNRRLIDQVWDIVPAIKPQLAYYEQYGIWGLQALQDTITYARKRGMLVILDGKRNDIGSTASAYARAYLGESKWIDGMKRPAFDADALTVNAYLGSDGIEPFLTECQTHGKGLFILVRTSNPSAAQLQDATLANGKPWHQIVAEQVANWGQDLIGQQGYSAVGAVVGATFPKQAEALRKIMPQAFILVPGYGAQGATADDTLPNFGRDRKGAIVNASRSLMCAWRSLGMDIDQFDLACRQAALHMRTDLRQALKKGAT